MALSRCFLAGKNRAGWPCRTGEQKDQLSRLRCKHDNPVPAAAGMVFFCHMIIFDSARSLAMTLGRTSLITERGAESLSEAPLELVVA